MIDKPAFRLIEHTADIGLEVRAATREELFLVAAEGMKALLFGTSPAVGGVASRVVLNAGDSAELLVAWLNEVLFICETRQVVPATFVVEEITLTSLIAVISGEAFDPARHSVERTAKAVTYHQLVVEERDGGWYARVYIDL